MTMADTRQKLLVGVLLVEGCGFFTTLLTLSNENLLVQPLCAVPSLLKCRMMLSTVILTTKKYKIHWKH